MTVGFNDSPQQVLTDAPDHEERQRLRLLLAGTDEQISEALAGIHQHFRPILCRWLMRRYPDLQPDALDDIWADTLLAVLRVARQRRFRSGYSLGAWLARIARSRLLNHFHRRSAAAKLLHRLHSRQRPSAPPAVSAPLEAEDLLARGMAFLPQLSPQQREVLRLVLEQAPERPKAALLREQLSERVGRPVSQDAVKFSLRMARRQLAEHLQGKGYDLPEHLRPRRQGGMDAEPPLGKEEHSHLCDPLSR